jgi:hypothetical protein
MVARPLAFLMEGNSAETLCYLLGQNLTNGKPQTPEVGTRLMFADPPHLSTGGWQQEVTFFGQFGDNLDRT